MKGARQRTLGVLSVVALGLLLGSCRPQGPFDVDLTLVGTAPPPQCAALSSVLSGLECVEPGGSCIILRPVEQLEVHLELVEMPDEALGARVPEILGRFCLGADACPVRAVGEPLRLSCGGIPAASCLVRELGSLDAMADVFVGPSQIDVRGTAMFRIVVNDAGASCAREDPSCTLGCAYTLPLRVGSGPLEATMALDAPGGCGAVALATCSAFAGTP